MKTATALTALLIHFHNANFWVCCQNDANANTSRHPHWHSIYCGVAFQIAANNTQTLTRRRGVPLWHRHHPIGRDTIEIPLRLHTSVGLRSLCRDNSKRASIVYFARSLWILPVQGWRASSTTVLWLREMQQHTYIYISYSILRRWWLETFATILYHIIELNR